MKSALPSTTVSVIDSSVENVGGIVLNAEAMEPFDMQRLAREINAPVTGFVTGHMDDEVAARFFTPSTELPMCGHVTIGLFSMILENDVLTNARDFTLNGITGRTRVRVAPHRNALHLVMMQLPQPNVCVCDIDLNSLGSALGVPVQDLARDAPIEVMDAGLRHLLVHLPSLQDVNDLQPDFTTLAAICREHDVHTVGCFSMETDQPGNDIHLRDFCPAVGIDEVPASGTTTGALSAFVVRHQMIATDTRKNHAYRTGM